MWPLLWVLVLGGSGARAQSDDTDPEFKGPPTGEGWMGRVADTVSLAALNLPGTHNSGARYEPFPNTARCQTLSIPKQLEAGVRFLDIRCRHDQDQFNIFHGPIDQRLTFAQVVKDLVAFLSRNPRETLIVSIKQEHRSQAVTRSFPQTLQSYIDQNPTAWYTKTSIPQLRAVRGKIVLLRRFPGVQALGIPATDWGHDGFHQGKRLFIQDRFQVSSADSKWRIFEKAIQHSLADQSMNRLHLHFASGYTQNFLGIPNITSVSTPVNRKLAEYLNGAAVRHHGCLVLDFITADLAKAIYSLNFHRPK